MLTSIHISNYKSIKNLDFSPKSINLFIGENGAGKSNILEAITMYFAARSNMLSNEFLLSRGIRPIDPLTTLSIFKNDDTGKNDSFGIFISENLGFYSGVDIKHDVDDPYKQLKADFFAARPFDDNEMGSYSFSDKESHEQIKKDLLNTFNLIQNNFGSLENLDFFFHKEQLENIKEKTPEKLEIYYDIRKRLYYLEEVQKAFDQLSNNKNTKENFIIFNPETHILMGEKGSSYIQPLGINGEGLFTLLKIMAKQEPDNFKDVIELATIFNWIENIEIIYENNDIDIRITDRFMGTKISPQNANEGFLFTLFYACLFCSNQTPKVFAIENIDKSLNPRLCQVLIKSLTEKAKKHKKQIFMSTHNPAVLDGIDLLDDEQTIFVVERDMEGKTKLRELTEKNLPKPKRDGSKLHLSEAFLRGLLGGLPSNF